MRWSALAVVCLVNVAWGAAGGQPAAAEQAPATSAYVALTPTRLADTRQAECGCTPVGDGTIRVAVTGAPDGAVAAVVTVTALPHPAPGFVTAYPAGTGLPDTSTLNTRPDRPVANTAIIPLADGALDVYRSAGGDVAVDLAGVFVPAATAAAGRYMPVAPQRLLDTRDTGAPGAPGRVTRVPLPAGVAGASAVAVNVTHVGSGVPGYVGNGSSRDTSFLNQPGATVVAAATIAPVADGAIELYDHGGGHLIVDLTGWFTAADAPDAADGLFVALDPVRLHDTRNGAGRIWSGGTIEVASPSGAAALVSNVTVTRPDRPGFVTAYPAGTPRPGTSSVNPTEAEHTLANLAITPVTERGTAYFASAGTDLIVDATGYFTGTPAPATEAPAPNDYPPPRVLVIGDSGLRGIVAVNPGSQAALVGAEWRIEAAGCRRLHEVSCTSPGISTAPPTALAVLQGMAWAGQHYDIVIITAGHNDASRFELAFERVVTAARAVGAHTIVWQNYSALSTYGHLARNTALLDTLVARPGYADVRVADWRTYTLGTGREWLWDGIHMTSAGAWAQTDYLSRWVASLEHRPCPAPWFPGGPLPDPCPNPDLIGPPSDPAALYP